MTHPGLPDFWALIVLAFMLVLSLWLMLTGAAEKKSSKHFNLIKIKSIRPVLMFITSSPWPLFLLKIISVSFFILVIYAGLKGTPIPERNIATVLTWNIWWAGLIISIFFFGSAWCAICPWDALATWFVKPKIWINKNLNFKINNSLQLTPPKWLRNVWPALIMFVGLTWLELGVGVTTSPYWTALLSLLMVVMATLSLAIFKNKAFCHYICPVGRTVGFYSQLAPIELRPINSDICANCTTLECFNGTEKIDACPTQLVMGSLKQNTYCTSCGNCTQSCPEKNISWRLRPHSNEAVQNARPHWDEAWFMIVLLALTSFHGITMLEFWESTMSRFAQTIGDSGQLLVSFSAGLIVSIIIPVLIYSLVIFLTRYFSKTDIAFKKLFSHLVFITLPLAFAYHLAHNLNHMIRESVGASQLFYNPLGLNAQPLNVSEDLLKEFNMLISQDVLFALQAMLMMFGFWVAINVLRYRARKLITGSNVTLLPLLTFIVFINSFHIWMLTQPMVMRMGSLCIAPVLN
ncbi:Nitrogen assimilation regulatory protein [hydrothermal vent metagenome]|uniref:Nitrogen assimilation regulatory protein n=1 Tax=hydrothermal vent metagenome TaxID=652676 RepID=A0A3B0WVM7_9ZZZZ